MKVKLSTYQNKSMAVYKQGSVPGANEYYFESNNLVHHDERADEGLWKLKSYVDDYLKELPNKGKCNNDVADPETVMMRSWKDHKNTYLLVRNVGSMYKCFQKMLKNKIYLRSQHLDNNGTVWIFENLPFPPGAAEREQENINESVTPSIENIPIDDIISMLARMNADVEEEMEEIRAETGW